MKYRGSCHCGKIAFDVEFDGEIKSALSCNCSICQRKGSLLQFVPRTALQLLTPEDAASVYQFNKHKIKHRFCPTCGISPYAEAAGPDGTAMAAINVRCLEDIDLTSIAINHYDGRSI
jgi:hypothetical protein